jgi:hypothetical protein
MTNEVFTLNLRYDYGDSLDEIIPFDPHVDPPNITRHLTRPIRESELVVKVNPLGFTLGIQAKHAVKVFA